MTDERGGETANSTVSRWQKAGSRWRRDAAFVSMSTAASTAAPPIVAALLGILIPFWLYRLWTLPLGIPLNYCCDALPVSMIIKEILNGGWFYFEPRLGAPFGQHHIDWPQPNFSTHAVMWFFGLFTDNYAVILNVIFLAGFPLAAVTAWWVMRSMSVERWVAVALGVTYAILPYHFSRGQAHLYLGLYYVIPFAVWLCIRILEGSPIFRLSRRTTLASTRVLLAINWFNARTLFFVILIAAQDPYYGYMAGALIAISACIRLCRDRHIGAFVINVIPAIVMATVIALCALPSLLWYQVQGANPLNASRSPGDTDAFGLKLSHMLLPTPGHRIDALADYTKRYFGAFPLPSEGWSAALGVIGAVGLLYLIAVGLIRLSGQRAQENETTHRLSMLVFAGIFLAGIGGISTFLSFSITPVFRSLSRMSIIIGFCVLCAIGLFITRVLLRFDGRRGLRPVTIGIVAITILFATFDQTNDQNIGNGMVNSAYLGVHQGQHLSSAQTIALLKRSYLDDQKYFRVIESKMPPGALIYNAPYTDFFATSKYFKLREFESLQPFLHTRHLRWSYGAQEGRLEANWHARLQSDAATKPYVFDLVAAGFSGLLIDKYGFDAPNGDERIRAMSLELQQEPLWDAMQRRAFFDLRGIRDELQKTQLSALEERKSELLFPASVEASQHFRDYERDDKGFFQWAEKNDVALSIRNVSKTDQRMHVEFGLGSRSLEMQTFSITWPDGVNELVHSADVTARASHDFVAKPGRSEIRISTNGMCESNEASKLCFRVVARKDGKALSGVSRP